jgi:hypothetical protein
MHQRVRRHAYMIPSASSSLFFQSPWWQLLLVLAAGLLYALFVYFRNSNNFDVPRRAVLTTAFLRAAAFSLACLLLLDIFLKRVTNQTENPAIIVAMDNSNSMVSGADSTSQRKQLIGLLNGFRSALSEKYSVRTVLFGGTCRVTDTLPHFSDKETDIDQLLKFTDNNFSNQNIGAMVVISDGIYNRGINPVFSGAKPQYPVFTVGTGDTTEVTDLSILRVNHNQVAYAGNNFQVEVIVTGRKLAGEEALLTLLENQQKRAHQLIRIGSDRFTATVIFTLQAQHPGVVRYNLGLPVKRGEKNIRNNSFGFAVEVIDNKQRILLAASAPHPDISAIAQSLAASSVYEFETTLNAEKKNNIKAYSMVIVHGMSAQTAPIINECRQNGVPFLLVDPSGADNLPGLKVTGPPNKYNDAEPLLNPGFALFTLSDKLRALIPQLPATKCFFGKYSLSMGADALVNQKIGMVETGQPLFYFVEENNLKCGVFIGDGLWKWRMRDFQENGNQEQFSELIGKSVQWLSLKSDKSFFRINTPAIINENESLEIQAEVYNKSYEPVTDPDVTFVLKNARNETFNYTFSKKKTSYILNPGPLSPAEYRYEATVKVNNELLKKNGVFIVKEIASENTSTVADHRLLYNLALHSGGKLFYPQNIEQLQKELLNSETIKPVTFSQSSTVSLTELKVLFFILLVLLGAEWLLRKRYYGI